MRRTACAAGWPSRPWTCGLADLTPPADPLPPAEGTPAFRYLVQRQLASFEFGLGPARFYLLGAPWRSAASRSGEVLRRELPRVRRELAAGRPAAIGLVHAVSANPATSGPPGCRGLGIDAGADPGSLSLRIYDPNLPGDDTVRLVIRREGDRVMVFVDRSQPVGIHVDIVAGGGCAIALANSKQAGLQRCVRRLPEIFPCRAIARA